MKMRLLLSVMLIAALYGFWVALAKPTCLSGYIASFDRNMKWTCVAR
jgi:hypothetical protein